MVQLNILKLLTEPILAISSRAIYWESRDLLNANYWCSNNWYCLKMKYSCNRGCECTKCNCLKRVRFYGVRQMHTQHYKDQHIWHGINNTSQIYNQFFQWKFMFVYSTGLILGLRPADERSCFKVNIKSALFQITLLVINKYRLNQWLSMKLTQVSQDILKSHKQLWMTSYSQ